MKAKGFMPTLFVTRTGDVPDDQYRALHTPVSGPQMATIIDFLSCEGEGAEERNIKEWKWEEEGMTEDEEGMMEEELPEVAREAPR